MSAIYSMMLASQLELESSMNFIDCGTQEQLDVLAVMGVGGAYKGFPNYLVWSPLSWLG